MKNRSWCSNPAFSYALGSSGRCVKGHISLPCLSTATWCLYASHYRNFFDCGSASSLLSTRSFPSSGRHSTTSRRRRRAVSQHLPACPRPAKRSLSHVVKIMFVRAGNRPCTLFVHLDVATADVRGNKAAKASPRVNPCGSARVRKPERCKLYFELSIFRRDARVALWRHCSLTQ